MGAMSARRTRAASGAFIRCLALLPTLLFGAVLLLDAAPAVAHSYISPTLTVAVQTEALNVTFSKPTSGDVQGTFVQYRTKSPQGNWQDAGSKSKAQCFGQAPVQTDCSITISSLTGGTTYQVRGSFRAANHHHWSSPVDGTPTASTTQSNNANLSALTATSSTSSTGSFSALSIGTFAAATIAYTASVANTITHVKLTPTRAQANATIKVAKSGSTLTAVNSGSASAAIALSVGANAILVEVTAQDTTTKKTYTVTVTRASATATPTAQWANSTYSVTETDADQELAVTINFSAATTDAVILTVGNSGTATRSGTDWEYKSGTTCGVAASGVTSTTCTLVIKGDNLEESAETIILTLTAVVSGTVTIGTTSATTITITDDDSPTQSSNANLSALTASSSTSSGGTFSSLSIGTFASATTAYTASVANTITHVKLTPTRAQANATIKVGKSGSLTAVNSGSASTAISLSEGANAILVEVTAQDSTKKTYTVTVTRAAATTTAPVWSATLTPEALGSGGQGCSTKTNCDSKLTDNSFTVGSTDFYFTHLAEYDSGTFSGQLRFQLNQAPNNALKAMKLCVGSTSFSLSSPLDTLFFFANANLAWSAGTGVFLSIVGNSAACPSAPATPTVTLSATPTTVAEGSSVTVTATLSAAAAATFTIPITITADSAETTDYSAPGSLEIAFGATTGTATITTAQDTDTYDETFTVALGALPTGVSAGSTTSVVITIDDDDAATTTPTTVTLVAEPNPVVEGEQIILTMTLSKAPVADFSIVARVTSSTAEEGDHGFTEDLRFDFPIGVTEASSIVATTVDADTDDETFTVGLGTLPSGVVAGDPASVTITITDKTPSVRFSATSIRLNEGTTTTYTARLSAQPSARVTMALNTNTKLNEKLTVAPENLAFTTSNWNTPQPVTLTAKTDADSEHDEVDLFYSLSGDSDYTGLPASNRTVKVLVVDADGSAFPTVSLSASANRVTEGSPVTITAALSAVLTTDVVIPISLIAGTAEPDDYGTLDSITIPSGDLTATATLTTNQDIDTDDETLTVQLGAQLPLTVDAGSPTSLSLTIEDDEPISSLPTVSLSATPNPVRENESLTITATLSSAVDRDVTIAITLTPGGGAVDADAGDYGALNSITIPANSTSASESIRINDDSDDKDKETFTITLGNLPVGVRAGSQREVVVTIDDDDPLGLILSANPPRVGPGGTVVVTAMLDERPPSDATVTIEVVGDTAADAAKVSEDYTSDPILPTTLTIPTNAQSSSNAVTIEIAQNATIGRTITLTATTPIGGLTLTYEQVITIVNDLEPVHQAVVPEVARAVAGRVSGAISARIGQVFEASGSATSGASASLGGQRTLSGALVTHAPNLLNGHRPMRDLLHNSHFVLPLNGGGGNNGASSLSLWGGGKYTSLSGENDGQSFDGSLQGAQLGVDTKLRDNLLAGMALSWSQGAFDYETEAGKQGDYEIDLISLHPYFGGRGEQMEWWASAGYGSGEVEISPDDGLASTNDVTLQTLSVGGSGQMWADETGAHIRLKGEFTQTEMEIEESAVQPDSLTVSATLIRIALEARRTQSLRNGRSLTPSLSLGARHDGGDGNTGTGAEMRGTVHYHNPRTGVSASASMHTLLGRSDYEEWGIMGMVRLSAGADGQGLSFEMSPAYGNSGGADASGSGSGQIWSNGLREDAAHIAEDAGGQLEMRLGYGLPTPGERDGLLTPWSGMTLHDDGNRYRLGLDWATGGPFTLRLHGERRETVGADADHAVLLKGEARF